MANKRLLLVEGKDDKHVLWSLCKHFKVPETFDIKEKEGIEKLLGTLDVELEGSDLQRLGIIVDADLDLAARWQSLRDILVRLGYDMPLVPTADGTVVSLAGRPTIGVWIMPDNTLPGLIEDFVALLVPPGDSLWPRAVGCVGQIPPSERRFPDAYLSKAHVHTWLAWQSDPGTPMGLAITKRYLDANSPHAHALIDWIRRLFLD
jgi:hypothetical protein